jgi:hypothetical protein
VSLRTVLIRSQQQRMPPLTAKQAKQLAPAGCWPNL